MSGYADRIMYCMDTRYLIVSLLSLVCTVPRHVLLLTD